jgi:hypothetical protein
MKKFLVIALLAMLFAGCSSASVGTWQAVDKEGNTCELVLRNDGSLLASWHDGDKLVEREGTWKEGDNGEILLDGGNINGKAVYLKEKLVLETRQKVTHHFVRQIGR